jgi:4-azaleucine resistance transporter AzlC
MADSETSLQPASRLRDGARVIAPLTIAVLAFGTSYGLLARAAGMGAIAPIVMSATTFAGSAQFAAASILDNGGGVAAAIVAALLLNARYAPMGIAAAPGFTGPAPVRFLKSQLVVDESWALAARGGGRFDMGILLGAGLVLYPAWVGGTAVGVLAGDFLGDPERLGLDAAFPALFLALLLPQLRTRRAIGAAVLGGAIALALLPFSAPGVPIIAGSVACLLGLKR